MRFACPPSLVLSAAGLMACSAAEPVDDESPAPPTSVTHEAPVTAPAAGPSRAFGARDDVELIAPAAPTPFVCRPGAFCDDFEDDTTGFTRWSNVVQRSGGKVQASGASASVGRGAITLVAPEPTSQVFLDHTAGVLASTWSGLLTLALSVDAAPDHQLGGPELALKTADGPVSVRVSVRPEGLVLEQLAPECDKARCQPMTRLIAPAKVGAYYRVRVGFEVGAQKGPPYGRIETTVDGGPLVTSDLVVPLYDGGVSLRAGITEADTKRAQMNLDDVSLFTR